LGIGDVVVINGDAHMVSIVSLLWLTLENNLGVDDFPAAVG
jgi:hypothetical protein